MSERLQPVSHAADRLGVSRAIVWRLARQGVLPCVRVGRRVLIDPTALETWITAGGQALPGGWRREERPA